MQVPRAVEGALSHLAQRQVPSGVDLRGGEVRDRRVVVAVVVPVEGLGAPSASALWRWTVARASRHARQTRRMP